MVDTPSKRYVSAAELRRRFNSGDYWARAERGEFLTELRWNGHPTSTRSNEPFCTHSQIVAYLDDTGQRIAVVHQYLRPDATLGGSGRPDPKLLVEDGVTYRTFSLKPDGG